MKPILPPSDEEGKYFVSGVKVLGLIQVYQHLRIIFELLRTAYADYKKDNTKLS
jgi:hypothetical protein